MPEIIWNSDGTLRRKIVWHSSDRILLPAQSNTHSIRNIQQKKTWGIQRGREGEPRRNNIENQFYFNAAEKGNCCYFHPRIKYYAVSLYNFQLIWKLWTTVTSHRRYFWNDSCSPANPSTIGSRRFHKIRWKKKIHQKMILHDFQVSLVYTIFGTRAWLDSWTSWHNMSLFRRFG